METGLKRSILRRGTKNQKLEVDWRLSSGESPAMHWHDQRVHQSMEGRRVEHRDHLHRCHQHRDQHQDQHYDQLVHYAEQPSMEHGGEKQNKKRPESRTEKASCRWRERERVAGGERKQSKL